MVILDAIIGTTGDIDSLLVVSGHELLSPAAVEAVSQWKYEPFLLNGIVVPVATTINVNFTLQ